MLGVSSCRRYWCCWRPARSRDERRWSAELAAEGPARSGAFPGYERRDPRGRVEAGGVAEGTASIHAVHDPAGEVLVEGIGVIEPGERASDARSERERERVGAGEVSTHMYDMSSTPVVHDVDNLGHCEEPLFTKPRKAFLFLFVYVTPVTTPVSPTAALGHLMVSPSL